MLKEAKKQERRNKSYRDDEQLVQVYQTNEVYKVNEGSVPMWITLMKKLPTL